MKRHVATNRDFRLRPGVRAPYEGVKGQLHEGFALGHADFLQPLWLKTRHLEPLRAWHPGGAPEHREDAAGSG